MNSENDLTQRKPTRLKSHDYSTAGIYFITICTENRKNVLSRIVGGDVVCGSAQAAEGVTVGGDVPDAPTDIVLLPFGTIADGCIRQLDGFYPWISVDRYVIMPNHIHLLLTVFDDGASRTSPPTRQHASVSQFVSTFKRFCNKEYGKNIWQRHFYDHIIRNREDYEEHLRYIRENPIRWYFDELYKSE